RKDRHRSTGGDLGELPLGIRSGLSRLSPALIGRDAAEARIGLAGARFGMLARFEHQEGSDGTEDRTAALIRPRPYRGRVARPERAADGALQDHVLAAGKGGAANEEDVALAGTYTPPGDLDGADAGDFLTEKGARRAGHLVHDGDVAGEEVGQLRQEKRRAQVAAQALIEEFAGLGRIRQAFQDGAVSFRIAFAGAGRDDQMRLTEELRVS